MEWVINIRFRKRTNNNKNIKDSSYIIFKPNKYKGKWSSLFKNNHPIDLEIGIGKGHFILNKAISQPQFNFIGIEKYEAIMACALKKIDPYQIANLKLIIDDAANINQLFDREIKTIYFNFPDPWPKTKHMKRRLLHDSFIKKYDSIFKGNPQIFLKTDNLPFFNYAIKELINNHFQVKVINYKDLDNNIMTEYEMKYLNLEKNIYYLRANKNK